MSNILLDVIKRHVITFNGDCQYSKNLEELTENPVNTDKIIKILTDGYMYHKDMEAVNCVLESYIRKNNIAENSIALIQTNQIEDIAYKKNIVTVKKDINTYIKNIRPLSSNTASSDVYLADLFVNDISLVIKFPNENKKAEKIQFMKEYILGKALNKLRQITPSFMYTFSLFGCGLSKKTNRICTIPKSLPLLILEKVNGISMQDFIMESSTTFEVWLKVYVQILLNLEIAQKLYHFNHNDLHTENIMIRKHKQPITYSFNSETKTYKVTTDTFPVLIDFGYSGMDINDERVEGADIGQAFPPEFTTCYDMYLHITRCGLDFFMKHRKYHSDLQNIGSLYTFFKDDPYDIYNDASQIVNNNDWFEKINYSKKMLRKTPGEFLDWIMDNYSNIIQDTITKTERKTYINPLPNNSDMYNNFYISKYHEIIPLKTDSNVITKIIKKFNDCTTNQEYQSYITSVQTLKILESMTNNNTNKIVKDAKIVFTDMISNKKRKDTLVASDLIRLNTIFTNPHFDFIKDSNFNKDTLENNLRVSNLSSNIVIQILGSIEFVKHIKPYYNIYLMIKELQLSEYDVWVSKFENLDIFKYYERFADKADRFNRFMGAIAGLRNYPLT